MTVLGCKIRKDKAEQFKAKCKEAGTTPNAVFTAAIDDFMLARDNAVSADAETLQDEKESE